MNPNDQVLRLYALNKLPCFQASLSKTKSIIRTELQSHRRALDQYERKAVFSGRKIRQLGFSSKIVIRLPDVSAYLPEGFERLFHLAIAQSLANIVRGLQTAPDWNKLEHSIALAKKAPKRIPTVNIREEVEDFVTKVSRNIDEDVVSRVERLISQNAPRSGVSREATMVVTYLKHAWFLVIQFFPPEEWGFPSEMLIKQLLRLLAGHPIDRKSVAPEVRIFDDLYGILEGYNARAAEADGVEEAAHTLATMMIVEKLLRKAPAAVIKIEPVYYESKPRKGEGVEPAKDGIGIYHREAKSKLGLPDNNLPRYTTLLDAIDDYLPHIVEGCGLEEALQIRGKAKFQRKRRGTGENAKKYSRTPSGKEREAEVSYLVEILQRTGLSEMPGAAKMNLELQFEKQALKN